MTQAYTLRTKQTHEHTVREETHMAEQPEKKSKVALITGAASGICRATACRLARDGADVAVCDINDEGAHETADMVADLGRTSKAYTCDMSSHEQVVATADKVIADFGKVDILVNGAGTGDSSGGYEDITSDQWDRIYAINIKNPFFLAQRILKDMVEKKIPGCIVNIASTEGKTCRGGSIVYGSSKAAMIHLTQSLAFQLAAYDIRVNAVCPGLIDTPIWHRGDKVLGMEKGETIKMIVQQAVDSIQLKIPRAGKPEEVAGAVAFLCSEDASYMTGQAINVCGGMECR